MIMSDKNPKHPLKKKKVAAKVNMADHEPFTYSNRRASIGSSLDAFTAGRSPNTTPIIQQKSKLTKTEKRDRIYG